MKLLLQEQEMKHLSYSEWCFKVLKKAILNGELPPGKQLKETEISKELNISRSPVREAIQRLAHEGLAEIVPHKGASVTKFSFDDVSQLIRVRMVLECLLVRELCQTITGEKVEFCRKQITPNLETSDKEKVLAVFQQDFDFHEHLIDICENPFLVSVINIISGKIKVLRAQSGAFLGRDVTADREHLTILDAIGDRNADLAEALLKAHLENAKKNIIALISTEGKKT